jgi:hypothetical protein
MIRTPNGYQMIKIATFNTNIVSTVALNSNINKIIDYLISSHRFINIDILCLQGIGNSNIANKMVTSINKKMKDLGKKNYYYAPKIEDIQNISSHAKTIKDMELKKKKIKNNEIETKNKAKAFTQNIIISKYPIVDYFFSNLDDDHDFDDILGVKTLICANISIHGNIISVYNLQLASDINSAKIDNVKVRERELETLKYDILRNKVNLKSQEIYKLYVRTDIHLLLGSLNINETKDDNINSEYFNLIKTLKCVDIFRCYVPESQIGFTTVNNERYDYIMLLLSDKLNVSDYENILASIHKKLKIHTLDMEIRDDLLLTYNNNNFPVEFVFMIYTNEH